MVVREGVDALMKATRRWKLQDFFMGAVCSALAL